MRLARDVEGMLAHLDPEVRFHPLRLSGLDGSYRGHDGVQRWFARQTQLHHDYAIVLSEVCGSGDDKARRPHHDGAHASSAFVQSRHRVHCGTAFCRAR
jgi:SnoaL-like domain